MSDVPPVPEASTPPYPAHPAPIEHAPVEAKAEPDAETKSNNVRKYAAAGAAIGIGSAAIVAALLYTNRKKS